MADKSGFGVIQFGEVTSYGSWTSPDGELQISFETRSLSPEKQGALEHYRNSCAPLQVQLKGDHQAKTGVVIALERNNRTATFYVRRD